MAHATAIDRGPILCSFSRHICTAGTYLVNFSLSIRHGVYVPFTYLFLLFARFRGVLYAPAGPYSAGPPARLKPTFQQLFLVLPMLLLLLQVLLLMEHGTAAAGAWSSTARCLEGTVHLSASMLQPCPHLCPYWHSPGLKETLHSSPYLCSCP